MKVPPVDLVEDRPAGVEVAELAELPQQLLLLVLRADRVAHGDPAPSLDAVHDEGAPALAEEQRLVAEQGQVRVRAAVGVDDGSGPVDGGVGRRIGLGRGGAQQSPDREEEQRADDADGGAQESRRVGAELEMPP